MHDTLLNPQVIIEVASDSTANYDRTKKFDHYRTIESLREYVLVTQKWAHIDRFSREDDARWTVTGADGLEASIELPTIDCQLKLADAYARVKFPPIEEIHRAAGIFGPGEPR